MHTLFEYIGSKIQVKTDKRRVRRHQMQCCSYICIQHRDIVGMITEGEDPKRFMENYSNTIRILSLCIVEST